MSVWLPLCVDPLVTGFKGERPVADSVFAWFLTVDVLVTLEV